MEIRDESRLGFSVLVIALIYWTCFVVLNSVSAVIGGYDYGLVNVPLDIGIISSAALTAMAIFILLLRLNYLSLRRQALLALAGLFILSFPFDAWIQLIRTALGPDARELTLSNAFTRQGILRGGLFWFIPFCLWSAAVMALIHNDMARKKERALYLAERETHAQLSRAAEAESKAARSELAMLRTQLDIHFMCNALNAISGLVLTGRENDAVMTLDRLAGFLRMATEIGDQQVPLREELDMAEAYLAVQHMRFDDRLLFRLDCGDETLNALLPNFLLQPLVENSVKYAVELSREPVEIAVTARREGARLSLCVSDNGTIMPEPVPQKKGGVGLSNIRARLNLHYGAEATLETGRTDAGYRTIITLPFRIASSEEGNSRRAATGDRRSAAAMSNWEIDS